MCYARFTLSCVKNCALSLERVKEWMQEGEDREIGPFFWAKTGMPAGVLCL